MVGQQRGQRMGRHVRQQLSPVELRLAIDNCQTLAFARQAHHDLDSMPPTVSG
jgi:hypothetical protein